MRTGYIPLPSSLTRWLAGFNSSRVALLLASVPNYRRLHRITCFLLCSKRKGPEEESEEDSLYTQILEFISSYLCHGQFVEKQVPRPSPPSDEEGIAQACGSHQVQSLWAIGETVFPKSVFSFGASLPISSLGSCWLSSSEHRGATCQIGIWQPKNLGLAWEATQSIRSSVVIRTSISWYPGGSLSPELFCYMITHEQRSFRN